VKQRALRDRFEPPGLLLNGALLRQAWRNWRFRAVALGIVVTSGGAVPRWAGSVCGCGRSPLPGILTAVMPDVCCWRRSGARCPSRRWSRGFHAGLTAPAILLADLVGLAVSMLDRLLRAVLIMRGVQSLDAMILAGVLGGMLRSG